MYAAYQLSAAARGVENSRLGGGSWSGTPQTISAGGMTIHTFTTHQTTGTNKRYLYRLKVEELQ